MTDLRIAVVGLGATGAVVAAALLNRKLETMLVIPRPGMGEIVKRNGIRISGEVDWQVPVPDFVDRIVLLKSFKPNVIFLSTKTFHMPQVLKELKEVFNEGTKVVSTHNGLGTEDVIAEVFGVGAAFRMLLNYGVSLKGPGEVEMAFFNRPNHLGGLSVENEKFGMQLAALLSEGGLNTAYVEDIKRYVWKKMIMKCTMASISAVTNRTLKQILDFPPTREIADSCFKEALAVAKAQGYDMGEDYLQAALGYLEKAGSHKDSMCYDVEHRSPTEIDFLGGKVVEYAKQYGISVPHYTVMTNLVRAMEESYLKKR